jgi:hypothetical protein
MTPKKGLFSGRKMTKIGVFFAQIGGGCQVQTGKDVCFGVFLGCFWAVFGLFLGCFTVVLG